MRSTGLCCELSRRRVEAFAANCPDTRSGARISLDLTGLPPTPEELDAFSTRDGPTRLSAARWSTAPHYGERMAVDWLDAARYADTNGYQSTATQDDVAVARLGDRHSTRTCRSTSSPSSNSPATCCPTPTARQQIANGFQPQPHDQRRRRRHRRGVPAPRTSSTASRRPWTVWLGRPSPAPGATTTSSIPSPRAISTPFRRSSTT